MTAIVQSKRRFVTLIEMLIVMFLIATIIGVLAYNYTGVLEEGKKFTTEQRISRVKVALEQEMARNPQLTESISTQWKRVLERSPLISKAKDFYTDGWGDEFEVSVDRSAGIPKVVVRSRIYDQKYGD